MTTQDSSTLSIGLNDNGSRVQIVVVVGSSGVISFDMTPDVARTHARVLEAYADLMDPPQLEYGSAAPLTHDQLMKGLDPNQEINP